MTQRDTQRRRRNSSENEEKVREALKKYPYKFITTPQLKELTGIQFSTRTILKYYKKISKTEKGQIPVLIYEKMNVAVELLREINDKNPGMVINIKELSRKNKGISYDTFLKAKKVLEQEGIKILTRLS